MEYDKALHLNVKAVIMKIQIENPCHENWDTMTPNQQGAFCHACMKTVIDFSRKSLDEIKDFFTERNTSEAVCGRFMKSQIKELSIDDFYERYKSWIFPKKLVIVLFLVFGFGLFSCQTTATLQEADAKSFTGKQVYLYKNNEAPKDSSKVKPRKTREQQLMTKGDVAWLPPDTLKPCVVKPDTMVHEEKIMGKIMIAPKK